MLRRWIARILLALITLEAGIIGGLYMDSVGWINQLEAAFFKGILSRSREVSPTRVILENRAGGTEWHLRPLIPADEKNPPELTLIDVKLTPELFDGDSPKPVEMAYLLAQVYKCGGRKVALTRPLAWDEANEIELRTLDSVLATFKCVLLPLEMSEVPRPGAIPDWLTPSLLEHDSLRGDRSGLPVLNSILTAPSITPTSGLVFAFPDFGARDLQYRAENRIPLLARWKQETLPSWSLALARQMANAEDAELMIDPGESLRFGENGPIVPLDDYGSAKITPSPHKPSQILDAKVLVPVNDEQLPMLSEQVVLIDRINDLNGKAAERLVREATALLTSPRPGHAEVYKRLPRIWELSLYLEIVAVAIFALYLRPLNQLISLLVLSGVLLFFVIALVQWRGMWTPVMPLVTAITIAWCLIGYLQQVAHPIKKKAKNHEDKAIRLEAV